MRLSRSRVPGSIPGRPIINFKYPNKISKKMALVEPKSMDECVYFTNRVLDKGKIRCWVFKEKCPKCGKSLMGKPRDPKTGKVQIRAKEFKCPECNYTLPEQEYENSLTANIQYTCQYCGNQGEIQSQFKRKKVQIFDEVKLKKKTFESLRFQCQKCGKNIDITYKMK